MYGSIIVTDTQIGDMKIPFHTMIIMVVTTAHNCLHILLHSSLS